MNRFAILAFAMLCIALCYAQDDNDLSERLKDNQKNLQSQEQKNDNDLRSKLKDQPTPPPLGGGGAAPESLETQVKDLNDNLQKDKPADPFANANGGSAENSNEGKPKGLFSARRK